MAKRNIIIEPAAGEAMDEIAREIADTPKRLTDRIWLPAISRG
jgi:hypothetical protein